MLRHLLTAILLTILLPCYSQNITVTDKGILITKDIALRMVDSARTLQSLRVYTGELQIKDSLLERKLTLCESLDTYNQQIISALKTAFEKNGELLNLDQIEIQGFKSEIKSLNGKIKILKVKSFVLEGGIVAGAGWLIYHNLK